MSAQKQERAVLPSVLDRLLDDEPENAREAPLTASRVMELLRRSIQRDLENFLNTRRRCDEFSERFEATLVGYGIPDLVGTDLTTSKKQKRFLRELEQQIVLHEPRFRSIRLRPQEGASVIDRSLQFRIDAVMEAEPAPESIVLNSSIEPVTRTINLRT